MTDEAASGDDRTARRTWAFLLLGLVALALFTATRPFDSDAWWHLASGRWMLDHGGLARHDPFSWTAHGEPWTLYSAGFDVGSAWIVRATNRQVLSLLMLGALVGYGLGVHGLALARGARPWAGVAATLAGTALVLPFVAERPQMWSYLSFLAAMAMTPRIVRRPTVGRLVLLGLLFAVWANVHLAVTVGVVIVGLTGFGMALRDRAHLRGAVLAAVVAFAGGLLTPYGVQGYLVGFAVRRESWMIQEWSHLTLDPGGIATLVFLGAVAWALLRTGRWRDPVALAPIVVFALLTFDAVRNTAYLVAVGAPELALGLSALAVPRHRARAVVHGATVGLAIVAVLGLLSLSDLRPADEATYAVRGTAAIPAGCRLLNEYVQGGYVIDHRWPAVRVSQDGRNDLYRSARLVRQQDVLEGQPGARRWLDAHRVDCVLARPSRPLVATLRDAGWRVLTREPSAVLLVRPGSAAAGAAR